MTVKNKCKWDGDSCIDFDTTEILCDSIGPSVTDRACYGALKSSNLASCSYVESTYSCKEIQPKSCEESSD